jgi:glycosyltransferase involved in cell wall biosynthesis|tara:strand:+ start:635 stop:1342 length:708 start_codon:yes stop_codon:yes gene_type:complete
MENITLSIYVPCYNEEENITDTLNNIKKGIQNISYEILIVDDGSKDETLELANKFKKENLSLNIKIFKNNTNKGIGYNYFSTAQKALGKYYMLINGDACDPHDQIKKIVKNIGKAEIILTYMIDPRGIFRKFLSRLFVLVINLITFKRIKYYNGTNIHLLDNVKLCEGNSSGFGYQAEIITSLLRKQKTYLEIEINQYKSKGSSESIALKNIPNVLLSIFRIFVNQIIFLIKKLR